MTAQFCRVADDLVTRTVCPWCSAEAKGVFIASHKPGPARAGDLSVCSVCLKLARFTKDGAGRLLQLQARGGECSVPELRAIHQVRGMLRGPGRKGERPPAPPA